MLTAAVRRTFRRTHPIYLARSFAITRKMSSAVSLWLSPLDSSPSQKILQQHIRSAPGPIFRPHVTLHHFDLKDKKLDEVVGKVRELASSIKVESWQLEFEKPIKGDSYHRSVYLGQPSADTTKILSDIKQQATQVFGPGKGGGNYNPHVSLHYGEAEAREAAFASISSDPQLQNFKYEVNGIDIVLTDGPVESWKYIGRATFGKSWLLRSGLAIGGEFVAPAQGKYIDVVNPATKRIFHQVPAATAEDVNKAVASAKRAFPIWRDTPVEERARLLRAVAAKLRERVDELAEYEVLDNGKPKKEAEMDIQDTAACFEYYAGEIIRVEKEEQNKSVDVENAQFSSYTRQEPVGVCGLIIPWNYPLLMAAWKVAPCLAAGCTAVLKPSEITPITALELASICTTVGIPNGVLNVITGLGPDAGTPLSTHSDVDKLAFTGSVTTGARVAEAGAKSVKNVSLELGGKSPVVVFEDVDIDAVVDWIMLGIFFNSGQVCSATSRLLVQSSIKDKLLEQLVKQAKNIKVGDGLHEATLMGPIVNETQYKKVLSYINQGVQEGATILCGGEPSTDNLKQGYFVLPTILDNVKPTSTVWREEIFGPVLSVAAFDTEEEALRLANDSNYGLAAAVMSADPARCTRVAKKLEAGIVWINSSQPTFVQAPWGGMKQSGTGRELGPWGLKNYLEVKQVTAFVDMPAKNWGWYAATKQ